MSASPSPPSPGSGPTRAPASAAPPRVADLLAPFAGRAVHLGEVSGNNGDELILRGAQQAIADAGCRLVADASEAELICLNGGFKSDFWPFANDLIRDASERWPDVPMAVLPSSFWYETTDFPALFAGRRAPAWIFAREHRSLALLRAWTFPCPVHLGLDHDMAMFLGDAEWSRRLRERATDEHLLIVERGDHESATGFREERSGAAKAAIRLALRVVPRPVLQSVATRVGRARSAASRTGSPFTEAALARIRATWPEHGDRPTMIADVSRRGVCDYEGFADAIARAAVVVTTRLHVGVLAALLGKPTLLVAGPNHKIPGVHAYSLAGMPHVRLVDPDCRDVDAAAIAAAGPPAAGAASVRTGVRGEGRQEP